MSVTRWPSTLPHTAVPVEDGLFHVLLGSTNPISVSLLADNSTLWLGITVGADSEMEPREQIASVPYAMIANTVQDESITTDKIADGAVTQTKLGPDVIVEPPDGSITTQKLADGAVTTAKIADGAVTQDKAPQLLETFVFDMVNGGKEWRIQAGTNKLASTGSGIRIYNLVNHYPGFKERPATICSLGKIPAGSPPVSCFMYISSGGEYRQAMLEVLSVDGPELVAGDYEVHWLAIGYGECVTGYGDTCVEPE